MSGMVFALVLFGCSDDGSACQRLATAEQTYESRMECIAGQTEALDSEVAMAADYPTVFAQCMTGAQLARMGSGTVDLRKIGIAFGDAAD